MNPCHELVTKHLVTRWDEALTAETFFFITHCLYLLSHCFSPLTPSHMSRIMLTWCWCQCDASSVCNTLWDCLVSIKPRAWLFNSRNIVATQSVALVPGILDHPPSSCFIFIQNFFLMFYFSNICWAKGPIQVMNPKTSADYKFRVSQCWHRNLDHRTVASLAMSRGSDH